MNSLIKVVVRVTPGSWVYSITRERVKLEIKLNYMDPKVILQ